MSDERQVPYLLQLHWQDRADPKRTTFVVQSGLLETADEGRAWVEKAVAERRDDCPEGCVPFICNEKSERFVMAAPAGGSKG